MLIVVALVVLAVFGLACSAAILDRIENKKQEAELAQNHIDIHTYLTDLLAQAQTGQKPAAEAVVLIWLNESLEIERSFPDLYRPYQKFATDLLLLQDIELNLPRLQMQLQKAQAADTLVTQLNEYNELYRLYTLSISSAVREEFTKSTQTSEVNIKAKLCELLQTRIDELAELALTSIDGYNQLFALRRDYQWVMKLAVLPANYNYLVAINVKNPILDDFVGIGGLRDIFMGEYRRMAAEALRDQDYTRAKIALAYSNANSNVRAELNTLADDLGKFIAAYEAERISQLAAGNE